MTTVDSEELIFVAGNRHAGFRLDQFVSGMIADCSRSTASNLIKNSLVRVDNKAKKPGYRICPGDTVTIPSPPKEPDHGFVAEPVTIETIYIDDHIIVINKPAGMVVHPAPGHLRGSLAHGLAYHYPEIMGVGSDPERPGIVHRLDKDTSGVMVAARSHTAWIELSRQFKAHTVRKIYYAFVLGAPEKDFGKITLPVFRNPKDRKIMAAGLNPAGKARHAETYWSIVRRFSMASRLECSITTGRTHQIRVHLCAMGYPVIGDPVYGTRKAKKMCRRLEDLKKITGKISRQMLHAGKITFTHPQTQKAVEFTIPMPEDMQVLQKALEDAQSV